MTAGLWRDIGALVRSASFAGAVPAIGQHGTDYLTAYEQVVVPIIRSIVDRRSRYAGDELCATCVKLCFLLSAYADVAGVPFRADVAVLGGAVARVYDDLVEETACAPRDERLAALISGELFTPIDGTEALLIALYRELERRLARNHDDAIYRAFADLHRVQLLSRDQRDPAIPGGTLAGITTEKGGHALVVLFALVRPGMTESEMALTRGLGGTLQLVDDYLDVPLDVRTGITTMATRGEVRFSAICRQLRALRPTIRTYYGRDQPLYAVLYVHLWLSLLGRHRPRWLPTGTPIHLLIAAARRMLRRFRVVTNTAGDCDNGR